MEFLILDIKGHSNEYQYLENVIKNHRNITQHYFAVVLLHLFPTSNAFNT